MRFGDLKGRPVSLPRKFVLDIGGQSWIEQGNFAKPSVSFNVE